MVDPKSVIDEDGDFTGAHDKFESIKKAAARDLSELKQPGAIIFIGDNCVTKEEIYATLFGASDKAKASDVTSTATVDMSCNLYSTAIGMSATLIVPRTTKKDYDNSI